MAKDTELEDMEWLEELNAEPPIIPYEGKTKHGQSKNIKYTGQGWKYYLSIKYKLPEWWEEFNGKMSKNASPLYKTIWQFIKTKTKNKQQQEWLYKMFGPAPHPDEKMDVPWLGDWIKRRKNGYWNTEDGYEYRRLAKVIKNNIEATEAVRGAAPFILQDIVRFNKLQSKIEEAFNGQPFLDNSSGLSHSNKARFRTFLKMMSAVTLQKNKAIHEWMRIHGIDPYQPHQMHDMAMLAQLSGQVGAAGALTGYMAGQNNHSIPTSTDPLTKDVLMLASAWTQKGKEFNKKLPDVVLNGDELVEKHSHDNSEKTNGKHREKPVQ